MGLFDFIQNLTQGVTDTAMGSVGDVVGGITDNQIVQDVQEHATTAVGGATDTITSVTEQVPTSLEDITQKFGL